MALQFSTTLRNARLDQIETTLSTAPVLRIYSGTAPAAPSDAATGTLLASCTLPSDWMAAASGGTKAKSGTWEDVSADGGSATAPGYFRIWDSSVTTCHVQGTAGVGSGDLNCNGTFTAGQSVTINSFTITEANA